MWYDSSELTQRANVNLCRLVLCCLFLLQNDMIGVVSHSTLDGQKMVNFPRTDLLPHEKKHQVSNILLSDQQRLLQSYSDQPYLKGFQGSDESFAPILYIFLQRYRGI